MKTKVVYAVALAVIALGACKKDTQPVAERPLDAATIILPSGGTLPNVVNAGDILQLNAGGTYILDGKCYVDSLAKIVIGKGATIKGVKKGTPQAASALIICRGGMIDAKGDSISPILFTSNEVTKASGDWGGIVVLGKSTVNKVNPAIEGVDLPSLPVGIDNVNYGGGTPADSSGRLEYIKILFAGASISANNELNGLTLGGVGSRTTVNHIYVYAGADDAFEFFGGTVNASYLIAHSPNDDCFDFDFGYTGKIQYALSILKTNANVFNADANGIESDNDNPATSATPFTRPVISNLTIIGGSTAAVTGSLHGNRWRRNTTLQVRNSIVMGYGTSSLTGILFETGAVNTNFQKNLVHSFGTISNTVLNANNNQYITGATANDSMRLRAPFGAWDVNPATGLTSSFTFDGRPVRTGIPAALSPARQGADFTVVPFTTGFDIVTYRGAFDPTLPTAAGWAKFAL